MISSSPEGLTAEEAGCEKWHMVSFSWAPGQISIKYDNEPEIRSVSRLV